MDTRLGGLKVTGEFDARRWAAEETALRKGWLRECPYHGEPFVAMRATPGACAAEGVDPDALAREYAPTCPLCAREDAIPE